MLFSSVEFIVCFLPLVLAGYALLYRLGLHRALVAFLTVTSLIFYAWWHPSDTFWLLGSVVVNFWIGQWLAARPGKALLAIGVAGNLALLAYFKYTNFFLENVSALTGLSLPTLSIILPLAISFHTFQQIAYLVDIHRGHVHRPNFLHYTLFVVFFPQLIAGPIVHHTESLPQIEGRDAFPLNWGNIRLGLAWFVIGLQKKVVLADGIAVYADAAFSSGTTPSMGLAWVGALAYTLQLYFDFSGYSDMAIGLARMFGVVLPDNFNSPYKAKNIIEFWRRWHITLSRWLRDYLYISLGGNRKGSVRRHLNLMLTMLLGGLWHGAGWNFVIWGGLHGLYLMVNHAWHGLCRAVGCDPNRTGLAGRISGQALTLLAVVVAWVFFRATTLDQAMAILSGMAGLNPTELTEGVRFEALLWIALLSIIALFAPNTQEWLRCGPSSPLLRLRPWLAPVIGIWAVIGLLIVVAKGSSAQSFIYMVF